MVWVGRDLKDYLVPTPLPWAIQAPNLSVSSALPLLKFINPILYGAQCTVWMLSFPA